MPAQGALSRQWPQPWNVAASTDTEVPMSFMYLLGNRFAPRAAHLEGRAPGSGSAPAAGRGSGAQRPQQVAKRLVREAKHVFELGRAPACTGRASAVASLGQGRRGPSRACRAVHCAATAVGPLSRGHACAQYAPCRGDAQGILEALAATGVHLYRRRRSDRHRGRVV